MREIEREIVMSWMRDLDLGKPARLALVAEAASEHTGYEPEEVAEFMKAKFCPAKAVEIDDRRYPDATHIAPLEDLLRMGPR